MKYALISDIHGNLPAMELAMQDALLNGAQTFLFVGDYCTRAPWPREVVDRLRGLPDARIIRGNEEGYLRMPRGNDGQFSITYWTSAQLSPDQLDWLDALPERLDWTDSGVALHMTHCSEAFIGDAEVRDFRTWMLLDRYPDGPVQRETFLADVQRTLARNESLQKRLETLPAGIYIFGHTHSQWHARFGDHLLINPGSCGIPLDIAPICGAPYTLLTVENGSYTVEERRVPYDAETLIAQVKQTSQYPSARVWSELIFGEWRTRRDHIIRMLWYAERYARSIGDPRRPFAKDTWEAAYEAWLQDGKPVFEPER